MAIASYKDKETKDIAKKKLTKAARQKLPMELHGNALMKIAAMDLAKSLADLGTTSGLKLEKLSRDREGAWSIRINRQYRICFHWVDGAVENVEIVDYH